MAAKALEPAGLQPSIPEIQRDALIAIYNSTNGEGWFSDANWLGPPGSEASWYGVTVENGHVAILDLSLNYLEGTLPPQIGNLKELTELDLWGSDYLPTWPPFLNNNIGGQVPPEIGQVRELEFLDLSLNAFQDPLPADGRHSGVRKSDFLSEKRHSKCRTPKALPASPSRQRRQ